MVFGAIGSGDGAVEVRFKSEGIDPCPGDGAVSKSPTRHPARASAC